MTRAWLTGLIVASAVQAAPDALKTWRGETKRLGAEEKKFWRGYQGRFTEALISFRQEIELADAQPDRHKEATWDYSDFRRLYADYEVIQKALAEADLALAQSGHEKAAATLLKELLHVATRCDRLEKELAEAKPKARYYVFDQRMGIERHGLAFRERGLVAALAKCPDAGAFLAGEGFKRAAKGDGKRSVARRVAIMDAMAASGAAETRATLEAQLKEDETSLRIVALQALVGIGDAARPALVPLLNDPSPIVRRALLQEIRARGAGDAGWIGPVIESLQRARGQERAEALAALSALTKQTFGYAPDRWKEWYTEYRSEIESGKFDREQIEIREAKPVPLPEGYAFYGVESHGLGVVFVFEGSQHIAMPADWEFQRTRWRDLWRGTRNQWEDEHPSHQAVLQREFKKTLEELPKDARFGIVSLMGIFTWTLEGEKSLLRPSSRDIRTALKAVEKLPGRGWCSQFQGLRLAAAMGGLDPERDDDFSEPEVDTVFLFDSGDPAGGRYMTPEAVVAAFERFNRFRRLVVHTLRICNEKEPSEIVMKGFAEASGGTYVWLKSPPKG